MRKCLALSLAVIPGFVLVCVSALRVRADVATSPPAGMGVIHEPLPIGPAGHFSCESRGWYWAYEGIAHAQSFTALGPRIQSLCLRVAALNADRPEGHLTVELRDPTLKTLYAAGTIRPDAAGRDFAWVRVDLDPAADLRAGDTYVLVLSSPQTTHRAPWAINAIYQNVYAAGRHLAYADDILFWLTFANGAEVMVGPKGPTEYARPYNSGASGAVWRQLLGIYPPSPRPSISVNDPTGPLPTATRAR